MEDGLLRCACRHRLGDHQVYQLRGQYANHDGELVDRHKATAFFCRADFGDIKRAKRRGETNPDSANNAKHHENVEIMRQRRAQRGDAKQQRRQNQWALASQLIGAPARDQRTKNTAHQRGAHRPAGLRRIGY
ncbi:hypothetical protein D3C87_1785800 [compost metagenome]